MKKIVFLLLIFFSTSVVETAVAGDFPQSICEGGIHLFENGDFRLEMEDAKNIQDLSRYSSLTTFQDLDHLWLLYTPDVNGEITFRASSETQFVQMAVFKAEKGAVCYEIQNGKAEIARLHNKQNTQIVGLDYSIETGVLYTLEVKQAQQIAILLAADVNGKEALTLSWRFIPKDAVADNKVVDRRNDDFATTQHFIVRDKATKKALISNFSIEGSQHNDGLYIGSEFMFNISRNCKLTVKCDVEGYFYQDSIYEVNAFDDNVFYIDLERITSGKSISIQTIEFIPGGSEIKESSYPDLRRLRDFLALNTAINVEIQGHVFATGENTFAAQKVSEARAKRIMKYLTDNGIDKARLDAVGFGNTRPIYEKPKYYYEEQANRRVEIMVK